MILLDETDKSDSKTEIVIIILKEYRILFEYSLSIKFPSLEKKNEIDDDSNLKETLTEDQTNTEQDHKENQVIKALENQIECKLLSIDIINSISSFFFNESKSFNY